MNKQPGMYTIKIKKAKRKRNLAYSEMIRELTKALEAGHDNVAVKRQW